ncbi:MAG: hypothetical protein L6R37_001958 [Teloschistes peruensis]|nr:MAG: hypothetical protein L6R37_001958 [Teloschistes peruensis]
MEHQSFRRSQLIPFDGAAAGHEGVLSDPSGIVVIKPCKEAEIDFYQSASSHPHFAIYIPTFMGTISLSTNADSTSAADADPSKLTHTATMIPTAAGSAIPLESPHTIAQAPVVESAWAPSNGAKITTDRAIVLKNVAAGFKKPNILDVKLGKRLWDDKAPPAKRARLEQASQETTCGLLGLRIEGMRIWQNGDEVDGDGDGFTFKDGYKVYGKPYGRSLSVETIRQGFEEFFLLERGAPAKGLARKVINRFLEDLDGLLYVLEREESRIYSASMLFVYEGDKETLKSTLAAEPEEDALKRAGNNETHEETHEGDDDDEGGPPAVQALKLIDFAHAEWTPGQGPDENLLHGLKSTIKLFEGLLKSS